MSSSPKAQFLDLTEFEPEMQKHHTTICWHIRSLTPCDGSPEIYNYTKSAGGHTPLRTFNQKSRLFPWGQFPILHLHTVRQRTSTFLDNSFCPFVLTSLVFTSVQDCHKVSKLYLGSPQFVGQLRTSQECLNSHHPCMWSQVLVVPGCT